MFLARHTNLIGSGTSAVARFACEQIDRRRQHTPIKTVKDDGDLGPFNDEVDLLDQFLGAQKE